MPIGFIHFHIINSHHKSIKCVNYIYNTNNNNKTIILYSHSGHKTSVQSKCKRKIISMNIITLLNVFETVF